MSEMNRSSQEADPGSKENGMILALVVSHLDPDYMGTLQVEKLRQVGNDRKRTGQLATVRYISPFMGVTSEEYNSKVNEYDGTQKSYGFWAIPPDVGTTVVCFFLDGDPTHGFYLGCLQDKNMNFMVPGYAATEIHEDGEEKRVVVAEYNKKAQLNITKDATQIKKPQHPFTEIYRDQGTLKDDIRGITTSSARREWPSSVFGVSTPGPVDKDGPRHKMGKHEWEITKYPISRLGGSSFVMDDGDDKFLRIKNASEGPPDYAAVEDGELNGDRTLLHNELVRIRTRTGHQILLHNTEDLIYIGNARGTAWIELTSDGKMDIFCADSINIRTKKDFNFYCDRDFNLEVGRNFNTKVHGEMHTNIKKDHNLIIDRDQKIHIKRRKDETIEEEYRQTVKSDVKKYYATDYAHNIDGRLDVRIANGVSVTAGNGASGAKFAPWDSTRQDPEDPSSTDEDTSSPVEDVNGATPNRVDLNFFIDQRTTITGNLDINVTGHVYTTSGGTNETKAGGNIIETAPQIHMNGPTAATAETSEEARITAKSTIPLYLKTHKLPDFTVPNIKDDPIDLISILRRIPTPEPYPHHESLEPKQFKPVKNDEFPGLDRDVHDRYHPANNDTPTEDLRPPPKFWKKYTTKHDTFKKVKK